MEKYTKEQAIEQIQHLLWCRMEKTEEIGKIEKEIEKLENSIDTVKAEINIVDDVIFSLLEQFDITDEEFKLMEGAEEL